MLGLICLNFVLLCFLSSNSLSWYYRLWGLALGSCLSLFNLWDMQVIGMSFESFWSLSDGLSSSLICLTWWISLLMLVASQSSVKQKNIKISLFSWYICLLNFILFMTFSNSGIVWFYVFFEASLIPTLILILGWGYQPERVQAGMYMMMYTISASLPLLILILSTCSFFSMSSLCEGYLLGLIKGFSGSTYVGGLVFIVGLGAFLVKLPVFSVHLWLPKAHVEAPVAGSMILAGILLKLGGYGMLRMHQFLGFVGVNFMKDILLCFVLCGGVITSFICFRQVDLKSLIAYSSIGHMSLMLAGVLSNLSWGWQSSLGVMLSHGLCSSGLFALANYNYEKTGTRSMMMSKGMLLVCPFISMWWFLFCVINMAAPPSVNLLSEIMIFPFILGMYSWMFIPLGVMGFLAAVYSLYLYMSTQQGGMPKFISFVSSFKSTSLMLMFMHYIPLNLLIMKSDIVCSWVV